MTVSMGESYKVLGAFEAPSIHGTASSRGVVARDCCRLDATDEAYELPELLYVRPGGVTAPPLALTLTLTLTERMISVLLCREREVPREAGGV